MIHVVIARDGSIPDACVPHGAEEYAESSGRMSVNDKATNQSLTRRLQILQVLVLQVSTFGQLGRVRVPSYNPKG